MLDDKHLMSSRARDEVTRLAPSPTGALHLGNLRTFVINWILARQRGWRVVLRIDDLDGPRIKTGAEDGIFQVFRWVGLDWDGGIIHQCDDLDRYRKVMEQLCKGGWCYPCSLSRSEIKEACSAPHGERNEVYFPASLRPAERPLFDEVESCHWRFAVPDRVLRVDDGFCGRVVIQPAKSVGDFVVWTKQGLPSYQLAVVMDDGLQGVTQVVRGDDLLDSTGRQLLIMEAMGRSVFPSYTHLPLVLGPDGRRLAKRHGDTRVLSYRDKGVGVERIIGLMAYWCGTIEEREEMSLDEFVDLFDLKTVSSEPITMSDDDEVWLLSEEP